MKMAIRLRPILSLAAVLCLTITLQGCTNLFGTRTIGITGPDTEVAQVPTFAADFEDIEVPAEMDQDNDTSMIVKTDSFRGGVIQYTGYVDPLSLKDFMISAMRNNQWKLVGEAIYRDKMLAFVKPNESCIVVIKNSKIGKTRLILYVAYDDAAAVGLDPFGDSIIE